MALPLQDDMSTDETLPASMPLRADGTAAVSRSRMLMAIGLVFLLAAITLVIVAQNTIRPHVSPIMVHDGN